MCQKFHENPSFIWLRAIPPTFCTRARVHSLVQGQVNQEFNRKVTKPVKFQELVKVTKSVKFQYLLVHGQITGGSHNRGI